MPGSTSSKSGATPSPKASAPRRPSSGVYSGVVLYDAGSKSSDALTFGFEREDFEVFATEQPSEALNLLEVSNAPILAVSIGTDPEYRAEALSFIGSLQDRDPKRALAVVALGRRELREDALRAGADEFIAWPAFIRDAVTLARLAIASRPDGVGVSGLLEDYEVYFLVRALAAAGRSAVIDLERSGHKGQLHFARGELVAARAGRLSGVPAFHHLLLWGEATLKLRFSSPPGERKIHAPIDDLLQTGVRFVTEFEKLAARIGGPQATFEKRPEKFDESSIKVPTEVRRFAETLVSGATLVDLVESSPFKPFDTIKVCYRLCELGLVARRDPVRSISPLTAQLAVRDWLLGTAVPEQRSTVTEAGRRAAEAYAEAAARRVVERAEPEDLFGADETVRVPALEPAPPVIHDLPTAPRYETFADLTTDPETTQLDALPPVHAEYGRPVVATVIVEPEPVVVRPAAKARPAPEPENHFDEVDEAFFAKEEDLHRIDPVESFDDLDDSKRHRKIAPKKKWGLFGATAPVVTPAKKPAPVKPRKRR